MDTPQKTAEPFESIRAIEFGCTSRLFGKQCKTESGMRGQGFTVAVREWRDYRDLAFKKLDCECMLFQNLCVAPPLGPIELGNDRRAVFQQHLKHAVFVAVERNETTIATQAAAFHRIENLIGSEC